MQIVRMICAVALASCAPSAPAATADVSVHAPAFVVRAPARAQSRFGSYSGYRREHFSEYRIDSHYLRGTGGIRLAVSIVRPARNAVAIEERLGTVVMPSVYGRAVILDGKAEAAADQSKRLPRGGRVALSTSGDPPGDLAPQVAALIAHGFAVVIVDLPGRGTSFGGDYGYVDTRKRQAVWDVVSWVAAQPWSNGRVGAAGLSWNAAITLFSAFEGAPRALVAVFPESPGLLTGGRRSGRLLDWEARWLFGVANAAERTPQGPAGWTIPVHKAHSAMLVDEDADGSLARQALAEQDDPASLLRAQLEAARLLATSAYPGAASGVSEPGYAEWAPLVRGLPALHRSHVAVYLAVGAYDTLGFDLSPYAILQPGAAGTTRVMVHPAGHGLRRFDPADVRERHGQLALQTEMVRWFDAWLYSVDNGIGREARAHLPVLDATLVDGIQAHGVEYVASESVQLADTSLKLYAAAAGKAATLSRFDGVLRDHADTTGTEARLEQGWIATPPAGAPQSTRIRSDGQVRYGDLAWRDRQGITFTSVPLETDVIVMGLPRITLQVRSEAAHAMLYVYLEEVDARGRPDYVAEGFLDTRFRDGSKRAAGWEQPDIAGLLAMDDERGESAGPQLREVVIPLSATYVRFNKGHRVRIAIHGGDSTTLWTPPVNLRTDGGVDAAVHSISLGGAAASMLELPVLSRSRFKALRIDGPSPPNNRRRQ